MHRTLKIRIAGVLVWAAALAANPGALAAETETVTTAKVPVETFQLDNGLRFLVLPRPELNTVYAGWVAHVGSANERPGITGISHFFEHMMFKGTHTLGTTDIRRDLEIIAEQEATQDKIRQEYRKQRERYRLGEIDDPFADEARTPELEALEQRFRELVEEQRQVNVKDEFDKIYREAGATGLNAFTNNDMTGYFISVPANKLELWFWMESDRLSNPVFREFYSERDVVYEERRLRTESTPTGKFDEQMDAMFWQSHPYSWPVVGWPSDLEVLTQAQADEYFSTYYAPNNLTAILVGNVDLGGARKLAERYFGRIPRGAQEPPDVVTLEMPQLAEKRLQGECDCQPQVELRYHAVPFRHKDFYPLDVLEGLLNGPTGRLHKALVLDQEIANRVQSSFEARKWAGQFTLFAETRGEATPEDLEAALEAEIRRLQDELVPERELRKVQNNIVADGFRRLQSPFFQLFQLIYFDGLGDWEFINYGADRTLTVTAEDVQRVARVYFKPENRVVGSYYRKAGAQAEEMPPELAELPDGMRQGLEAQIRQIRQAEDAAALRGALQQMEEQKSQMPPPLLQALPILEREIHNRLEKLETQAAPAAGGIS
jgi:predicted Zn-dependent peptidase